MLCMRRTQKRFLIVLIAGYCLALIVLVGGLAILDADECPARYTQEQMDATGCIIGANIGLGFAALASIAVSVVTTLAAVIVLLVPFLKKFVSRRGTPPKP